MNIVENLYRLYYIENINKIEVPDCIEYREFGYGKYKKVDDRNISFKNEKEYKNWILYTVPYHLYKSLAYMKYPSNSGGAENKEIFRREIAFDIDVHKTEKCSHDDNWICEKCLEKGKKQALYIIEEFLFPDFGFEEDDIKIVFSGNRGYHIYLKPKKYLDVLESFNKEDRRFLLNYFLGKNLTLKNVGSGWRRRIAKELKKRGIIKSEKKYNQFLREKNLEKLINKYKSKEKIKKIINELKNLELDKSVIEDDIRLLRVINSLHGYTGFIVKELSYEELKKFNPLEDAVYEKFNKIYYNVEILDNKKFKIKIGGDKITHKSKKINASGLLFLFGHGIKFQVLQ